MKFRNLIPCEMCTHILGKASTLKILFDHQVPLSINGLDRGQLFARLDSPLHKENLYDNFLPYSESRIEENLKRFTTETNRTFDKLGISSDERKLIMPELRYFPGTNFLPYTIPYFLFHPYDEESMKNTIIEKLGWKRPDHDDIHSHHDCDVKMACFAIYAAMGTGGQLDYELSVDIREGKLSREKALKRLASAEKEIDISDSPYESIEEYFGIPKDIFERRIQQKAKIYPILDYIEKCIMPIYKLFKKQNDPFMNL